MHEGDRGTRGSLADGHHPLLLDDVDRLVARAGAVDDAPLAALRGLRDDLTVALAALTAAGDVLAADVAVLRHCLAALHEQADRRDLVEQLPALLAARPWGPGWAAPPRPEQPEDPSAELLVRCAPLMSAHEHMAGTDLTSASDVARTLGLIEEQLVTLTDRRAAVEVRLAEVRRAVVRAWALGVSRSLDTPA
ncbi:MAG TPA: hypothetical protein VEH82_08580 [Acidimicrobiales bacterium]|nr:hypothetical protein [Acidimicrobiales bacterium]